MSATTRRPIRARIEYDIETGIDQPPRVKESINPWAALRKVAQKQIDDESTAGGSFFIPCEDQAHAVGSRTGIQASGRAYYQKRGQNFTVSSSAVQRGDTWGVRSWVAAIPEDGEEEAG